MNVSIISTLFKRKEHSKKKIPNSLIKKHNIQIVKLKGNNNLKNNLNVNRLKISTHYLGEIDKKNFGITSAKLNVNMLKKIEKENEILKKTNNKEIKSKAHLSYFHTPRKLINSNNESFIFKFDKIDIPKYNSNLSCENIKFRFSGSSKVFKNILLKTYYNKRAFSDFKLKKSEIKKRNNSNFFNNNYFEEFENLYKYDNYFNKSKMKNHSRNLNFNSHPLKNVRSILSKNFSQVIFPYEVKYKKIKSNYFFNDSFSDEKSNNLLKSNNFKFRKIFNKIDYPIALKKF